MKFRVVIAFLLALIPYRFADAATPFAVSGLVGCRDADLPPTGYYNGIPLSDWRGTVCQEHADRINRLLRITSSMPVGQQPQFYEYVIPAGKLPGNFGVDMPVLRVVFPENSFFDSDSTAILPQAQAIIAAIAGSLRKEIPDVAVFVAGHTDSRGSEDYNQDLSVRRAAAVSGELREDGAGAVALWRIGFGKDVPIASNGSDDGMAQNRRVEFLFAAKTEAVAVWLQDQGAGECAINRATLSGQCGPAGATVHLSPEKSFVAQLDRAAPVSVSLTPRQPHRLTAHTAAPVVVEQKQVTSVIIHLHPRTYSVGVTTVR